MFPISTIATNATNSTNSTTKTNNTSANNQTQISTLDVSKDGKVTINVNGTEPCYLTLINNAKAVNFNWTVSGTNISADIMRMSFPFNTTVE